MEMSVSYLDLGSSAPSGMATALAAHHKRYLHLQPLTQQHGLCNCRQDYRARSCWFQQAWTWSLLQPVQGC